MGTGGTLTLLSATGFGIKADSGRTSIAFIAGILFVTLGLAIICSWFNGCDGNEFSSWVIGFSAASGVIATASWGCWCFDGMNGFFNGIREYFTLRPSHRNGNRRRLTDKRACTAMIIPVVLVAIFICYNCLRLEAQKVSSRKLRHIRKKTPFVIDRHTVQL